MRIRNISAIILMMGLLSCEQHIEPKTDTQLKEFPSSSTAYKPINNLPYLAWWTQFQDPKLNQLIRLGLKNNMDIHSALGRLQQAKGELQQVKLSWIPTVQLYAGYSTNPALGAPGGFYGVWPYYVLNIMKLYSQQKRASYYVAYYQAALSGVRLMVIGQISAAYFTLMAQLEQLRLLHQLDNDLKELIILSQQDIRIGLQNEIDLNQLRSDEQMVAAQISPVRYNIVVSQNALRYLINDIPGTVNNKNNFAQIDFNIFKPGSLPVQVLQNRPDLKMAEYAMKAANENTSIAYSNFFPALQLDDFLGNTLSNNLFLQASDAYLNANIAPSTLGTVAASKGAYQVAVAEFTKTIKRILKEVDTDYSANTRMREQFLTYARAEQDYRHKYLLQKKLLKTGLISYKELLQSKRYLDNLVLTTNQAKLQLALSLVVLYQDLAGGYAVGTLSA